MCQKRRRTTSGKETRCGAHDHRQPDQLFDMHSRFQALSSLLKGPSPSNLCEAFARRRVNSSGLSQALRILSVHRSERSCQQTSVDHQCLREGCQKISRELKDLGKMTLTIATNMPQRLTATLTGTANREMVVTEGMPPITLMIVNSEPNNCLWEMIVFALTRSMSVHQRTRSSVKTLDHPHSRVLISQSQIWSLPQPYPSPPVGLDHQPHP